MSSIVAITATRRFLSRPFRLGGHSADGRNARAKPAHDGRGAKTMGAAYDCSWAGPVSPAGCASDGGRTSVGPAQSHKCEATACLFGLSRVDRALGFELQVDRHRGAQDIEH